MPMPRTAQMATVLLGACAAIAIAGCAPNATALGRLLDASDFDGAVASVAGDAARENALAALLLEREAAAGHSPLDAVRTLASAGTDGRGSLERLADGTSTPAGALARIALSRRRPPGEKALAALLSDAASDVRCFAVSTWGDDLEAERLAALVLDRDPCVRAEAVGSLGRLADGAYSRVLRDTARLDPDQRVRSEAARSGRALGAEAVDVLREILGGDEPGVAQAALLGLGDVGTKEALGLLEERALGTLDETAVVAAAELARIGSEKGRARLREALADERQGIRATAAVNLARAELEDREELLLDLLGDPAPRVVLIAAAWIGDGPHRDRAVAALRKVYDGNETAWVEARDALAVLGDPAAAKAVEEALAAADEAETIRILSRVKRAPSLRARLVALLADERPAVRRAAAAAVLAAPKS
jgi:HEAT repeat protein